jgi:hypothetical protein
MFVSTEPEVDLAGRSPAQIALSSAAFVPEVRLVVASILFDSLVQAAFIGTRGETDARQVLFRAEEFDIHLRLLMTDEGRELLGQIQPRGTRSFVGSARLHLLQNGERIRSTDANKFGEFHFYSVPDGPLSLQIDLPNLTIVGALDVSAKQRRAGS